MEPLSYKNQSTTAPPSRLTTARGHPDVGGGVKHFPERDQCKRDEGVEYQGHASSDPEQAVHVGILESIDVKIRGKNLIHPH
jgi:hypothetical protein